ncbi:MAG: hypothetical protein RA162_02050 [Arsenophonus sp.]|nr:MAG: hypothetical protein RA162_02050 [Arsenophonus sp.]
MYILCYFLLHRESYVLYLFFASNNYSYKETNIVIKYELIQLFIISVGYRFIKIKDNSVDIKKTGVDAFYISGFLIFNHKKRVS